MRKRLIVFDFDGVIHSYISGWKGATTIPDKPIKGILGLLAFFAYSEDYEVGIFSSRARHRGGIKAMKKWLKKRVKEELFRVESVGVREIEDADILNIINYNNYIESSVIDDIDDAIKKFIKKIKFYKNKPPAFVTIDDRAIRFDGKIDGLKDKIRYFTPWYYKNAELVDEYRRI